MTTNVKATQTNAVQHTRTRVMQHVGKEIKPFQAFLTKFNNDGVMNFSAALAYNLLMAIFPFVIAILAILGLFFSQDYLVHQIEGVFPKTISSAQVIGPAVAQLKKDSGLLWIIAIILAIFNGSRLFILIEYCFGIIYHVRQRALIQQNVMALGMLLLFIILIPIMVGAAAAPAFVLKFLPGNPFLVSIGGILGGLLAAFILFWAIYIVVPNQRINPRNSWLGALVAGVALQIYLNLFSLYATRFLGGYAGPIGFAVILLIFFYYFAVILLIGAEVNAFFAEKVEVTPTDLVTMVHITTSHLAKNYEDKEKQAAASHKQTPTGSVAQQAHIDDAISDTTKQERAEQVAAIRTTRQAKGNETLLQQGDHAKLRKEKDRTTKSSKLAPAVEAIAGTGLAFLVEWFSLRKNLRK